MHERWVVDLLPIYMDKVRAFGGPLYGFGVEELFAGTPQSVVEGSIQEFLKRCTGTVAVAVVLDAEQTSNLYLERGVQLEEPEMPDEVLPNHVAWPAVYLRSTMHQAATPVRSHSRANSSSSSSSLLRRDGSQGSLSRKSSTGLSGRSLDVHVMEYRPQSGKATTFPHTEWDSLVEILPRNHHLTQSPSDPALSSHVSPGTAMRPRYVVEEVSAVTYRGGEQDDDGKDGAMESIQERSSLFNILDSSPATETSGPSSTFHVIPLSRYLTLAVIVKHEQEGSLWQRRRSKMPDEDIRAFLEETAGKLRVANYFTDRVVPRTKTMPLKLPSSPMASESDLKDYVDHVKEAFGLKQVNTLQETMRSFAKSPFLPQRTPGRNRRRRAPPRAVPMEESAQTFFLGAELIGYFD